MVVRLDEPPTLLVNSLRMFGGSQSIELRAGRLRVPDDGGVAVELQAADGSVQRIDLPYPPAGVGGLELVASPDERFAALLVYSGQSEQGYELFSLEPTLHHVSRLPYVQGEGLAPVFSPDSRYLAMVVTSGWRERGTGEDAENLLDPEARGEVLIDWGVLYVQEIPEGHVEASPIGTWIQRKTEPDDLYGWDFYESPRFTSNDRLVLPLPWGAELALQVPLGGPVTTPSPTVDSRKRD